ncbi:MAG TPA: SPOR domain-containing protein [Hydrogenophaga sp.]|uniref:SPOR domain-containing protein n=1 Tax=Hydrogenophaga sp. TaxID=1904254 RepID=UPI002C9FA7ED|nr:SPOR domain-containing protein [Hydrogenophaga sp.]HMN93519.1 SPOR domain-containing protein [Hydrogenophaga sp.]
MLKSRSGQPVNASGASVPSIELVRRRARHRLIGASVLVLAGVVGFSLLFDTQPRPISVDIPIEIPTRAAPAAAQVLPATPPPAASAPTPTTAVRPQDALGEREEVVREPAPPATAAVLPAPAPAAAPVPAAAAPATAAKTPAAAARSPANDGARAQALLEGRTPPSQPAAAPAEASGRLVVQVGAFADNARAQEVRMRLERAGLKTYTHVAETPEGRRIRVRVGPFDTRQEAEKAAERVKALNLPARILTL